MCLPRTETGAVDGSGREPNEAELGEYELSLDLPMFEVVMGYVFHLKDERVARKCISVLSFSVFCFAVTGQC